MADTRAITELTPTVWDDQFNVDYFQSNRFAPYMGTGQNSLIQIKEDLTTKAGQTIRVPFVTQLNGPTILDDDILEGNEEEIGSYFDDITVRPRAKGVVISKWREQLSAIDLRNAARELLRDWAERDLRDQVITGLGAVGADGDVPYATALAAQRNTWNQNNSDRVLYGNSTANYNATHATALANCDATNDLLTRSNLSLLRQIAITASPRITPFRDGRSGKRMFVAFAHPRAFRSLAQDLEQANREVSMVDKNSLLFQYGDLEYHGVLVHEVDDLPVLVGVGTGGTVDVSPVYLCGQQALGYGLAKRFGTSTYTTDANRREGVAMEAWYGVKKMVRRAASPLTSGIVGKQVGIATGFFALASS